MMERLLRSHWGIGDDDVELVLESVAVPPSNWLARVFASSPVTAHSDGLMTYGPTRTEIPHRVAGRIEQLCYLDLVPGLRPVLLSEFDVPAHPVPRTAMRKIFEEIALEGAGAEEPEGPWGGAGERTAVVVGQYLSALGLVSRAEEGDLHARMLTKAAKDGAERVVFKPHPSAPPGMLEPLRRAADAASVEFAVLEDSRPLEVLIAQEAPRLVVASFSTALMTARAVFDVPVASVGTKDLLRRLTPFENSNRVPATIIDAVLRPEGRISETERLQGLIDAVAHCMQSGRLRDLRESTVEFLEGMEPGERRRYFDPARLTELSLPGAERTKGVVARELVDKAGLRHALERIDDSSGGALRRVARKVR